MSVKTEINLDLPQGEIDSIVSELRQAINDNECNGTPVPLCVLFTYQVLGQAGVLGSKIEQLVRMNNAEQQRTKE